MAAAFTRDRDSEPVFVMVTGAAPGLGKSTLVRSLGDRFATNDQEVVVLLEAMIAERDEFADVMSDFRSSGITSRAALIDATHRFAATYRDRSAVVVQDMLLPYLPSLFAWGYSDRDIVETFTEIAAACAGIRLIQIHLDGSPAAAMPRAIEREDPAWLDWMITKVSRYADLEAPVTDLASLVDYLERARRRTHELLAKAPWRVVVIDADHGQDQASDDAWNALNA